MYNFWFDADRPPSGISSNVLHFFKAGSPAELSFGDTSAVFQHGYEN